MPQLLLNSNASGASAVAQWGGGAGVLEISATSFGGATVSLQVRNLDGTFSDVTGTALTADGCVLFALPPGQVRVNATAAPTGLNVAAWRNRKGRLAAVMAGSGGGGTQPLRFASPNNAVSNNTGTTMAGTQLDCLSRRQIWIGSGNLSELRLSYFGFNASGGTGGLVVNANAYSVVAVYLENSAASISVPITFGGQASKVINPGDSDVQTDSLFAGAYALSNFARNSSWFVRQQLRVASAGMKMPTGVVPYTTAGFPTNVGLAIDPAVYVASAVSGTGNILASGSGWSSFTTPYQPVVLGRFVTGDPPTILGLGDSIIASAGDTGTPTSVMGAFSRALFNSDGVTGAIGGFNMGCSGAIGSMWQNANAELGMAYWKYAKHAVEEFGTNEFITPNSDAAAQISCQAIWTAMRSAGIQSIIRTLLTPRCTSTDTFETTANQSPLNASWQSGGGAWALNDWLPTQVGASGPTTILPLNSVRAGTTVDTTLFYTWAVDGTAYKYVLNDGLGVHPSTFGHAQEAAEYRTSFAALT